MVLEFRKLHPDAVTPTSAHINDAGFDLTVTEVEDCNEYIEYKFGIAVNIPPGYFGLMVPRSSITKMNLMMKNSVGIIDAEFQGELRFRCKKVKFEDGTQEKLYSVGDRAAQLIIVPFQKVSQFLEVDSFEDTDRGTGGFGSTGN